MTQDDIIPGDDSGPVHLCPVSACDPFVAAGLEHEQGESWCQQSGPHSPLVTSHRSPLLIIRKKVSLCNNIITSPLLMTHNLMLNVIQPRRRRQEFSTDQTYTTHMPSKYLLGVELES